MFLRNVYLAAVCILKGGHPAVAAGVSEGWNLHALVAFVMVVVLLHAGRPFTCHGGHTFDVFLHVMMVLAGSFDASLLAEGFVPGSIDFVVKKSTRKAYLPLGRTISCDPSRGLHLGKETYNSTKLHYYVFPSKTVASSKHTGLRSVIVPIFPFFPLFSATAS